MMKSSWQLKEPNTLCKSNVKTSATSQWIVTREDDKIDSRSFQVYTPPNFCATGAQQEDAPLRIIMAFHGYGGRPQQEINKWKNVANALNSIIIAPMGTETVENHKLGWNAIECCGDPVLNEIDDLDFAIHGVMEVFLNKLNSSSSGNNIGKNKCTHVIATGFSNGGFFASLLGIAKDRPEWLVGIVPTGGYQYDNNAYSNTHQPLAVFMHHGGRDSVVNPNGCCSANDPKQLKKGSKSNCFFDIGVKQEECHSVQSVFHIWSQINGCKSSNDGSRSIMEGNADDSVESQCFLGNDCIEPTNFCIWTNEGHSWGRTFPGVDLMQPWMEDVFTQAKTKSLERHDDSNVPSTPQHGSRVGKSTFLSASMILLGISVMSIAYSFLKRRNFIRIRGKRKHSEDRQVFEEEMMVLSSESEKRRQPQRNHELGSTIL